MELSIIIVNWNTRNLLENCLRSIGPGGGGAALQTIVVDNNSSDGSREMVAAEFPQVMVINSGANLGFARANNLGLAQARAPLVLFLNPDTEVRGRGLRQMIEFMRANPSVGGLGCKIRDVSGSVQPLGLQWFPSPLTELVKFLAVSEHTRSRLGGILPYHDPERSGDVSKLFGACLLVRRSVLEEVGGFDERFFMYCEDVDLCRRISLAGWRLYYLSEVEVLHLGGSASAKAASAFPVLMMCESFSKFMRKHHGRLGGAAYRAAAFFGAQARLLILLGLKSFSYIRLRSPEAGVSASVRKYVAITKWCLGLKKPQITG